MLFVGMVEPERVVVEISEQVAHVRLNRPDKRNGVDLPMFDALVAAGLRLAGERTVRAVVLSGEGPTFCAGLDFASFMASADGAERLLARDTSSPANLAQRACWVWAELPVPVIAAIRGAAFGAGLQLALACDLRLVADDAKLSVMEIRYGLVPDMTASKTLLRLVRDDIARELIFTGRVVGADEAVAIGLATRRSDDPVVDALTLARAMAAQAPAAIRAAKCLCREAPELDVAAAFHRETELQLGLLGKREQLEAVQASLMKRAPVFEDPQ
jgi:enoyl-CoA hydratase/carnithine racemase